MAGIVFPDVAASVLPALQIQKSQQLMDLEAARQRKLDAEQERQNAAGQYVPGALQGDAEAFNNLARVNPGLAIQLRNLADQKDAARMKKAQENAQWLASGAGAVLNADPGERAAAYQAHLVDLQTRGIDTSKMPQQYSPAVDSLLRYNLNSGVHADKLLEYHMKTPQVLDGGGSTPGGPPVAPPGGPAPDRDTFVQNMMPHALAVSRATGIDPRLVIAQSALETGYGQHAPGNNYFGIKGGEGPQLNTTEAGPNGELVPAKAAFRTYGSPGESAQDYAQFLTSNPRYAGVLAAKDLPGQIDAMGKSGYATDPNYAAKLRQIAFSLPTPQQPTMGNAPPALANAGANAAPMPSVAPQQAGALPGNPVAMPQPPQFAQNGEIPQGGDAATGQPGTMPQPAPPPPIQTLHDYVRSAIPGAQLIGDRQTGQPMYDHNGYVGVQLPNGQRTFIPPPPKGGQAQFVDVHQNPNDPNSPIIAQRNAQTNELHPRNMAGQLAIPPEVASLHDEALKASPWYQSLPVTVRNNAEGLVSGDLPISTLSKRAGGGADFNTTVGIAQQLKPGWSPNEGVQRQVFEKSLADGNTRNGQAVQAVNIAPMHGVDLVKITDAINQNNPQAVQGIINSLKQQFGDTAVPTMTAARNIVGLEMLKAAVGSANMNQALEQQFLGTLSTASTADQTRALVRTYTKLLEDRANEMIDTGKSYNKNFDEKQIIHPRTQAALDYIKGPRIGAPGTPQAGQPVAPQSSLWDRVFGGTPAPTQNGPAAVRKFNPATGALE